MKIVPVILSGGLGSRLWPASRANLPKPFLKLPDGDSLLSKTYERVLALEGVDEIFTVTNGELFDLTKAQSQGVLKSEVLQHFILEPVSRNTAAAIATAAYCLDQIFDAGVKMLVLPADHLVIDADAFSKAVEGASELAGQGWLTTFGIKPERPETGYGYIEVNNKVALGSGFKTSRFVEKPSLLLAQEYCQSDSYYWNSGMFCFCVGTLLKELEQHAPELLSLTKVAFDQGTITDSESGSYIELNKALFTEVPDISIDYALMEKSDKVAVVPCSIGWSDVGCWNAIAELSPEDTERNRTDGQLVVINSQNNYVSNHKRLTALVGVDDLVIVESENALLVAHKDSVQDVKQVVVQLQQEGRTDYLESSTVSRVWGAYTVLEKGAGFKVKRIVVNSGASLSLQRHRHRSEHWVVVSGTAHVLHESKERVLQVNESTFIPAGDKHKLSNFGDVELVIIEVQSGNYLEEDDIERFD